MTQDQCLENSHQATIGNQNNSTSDQVSDDLQNSKISSVNNGVNCLQEFNVDVNSKPSADVVIVRNSDVDADSLSSGVDLKASEHPAALSSGDLIGENLINLENKISNADIIEKDMTVITISNSGENIRDIIANSEKVNKNLSETLKGDKNVNIMNNLNRSSSRRKNFRLSKSADLNENEDPIERLNKLRASISSALSEVKGVLKQYSTEQNNEGENESTPSSKPPEDDGPVRFRFVRKIRRRSVFSEDIEETPNETIESKSEVQNDISSSLPLESKETPTNESHEKRGDETIYNADAHSETNANDKNLTASSRNQKILQRQNKVDEVASTTLIENVNTEPILDNSPAKLAEEAESTNTIASQNKSANEAAGSEPVKIKTVKTKKVVKKDRRASIAAVEINQTSLGKTSDEIELKAQRRPSDSGTLMKQATRVKGKSTDKPSSVLPRKTKTATKVIQETEKVKKETESQSKNHDLKIPICVEITEPSDEANLSHQLVPEASPLAKASDSSTLTQQGHDIAAIVEITSSATAATNTSVKSEQPSEKGVIINSEEINNKIKNSQQAISVEASTNLKPEPRVIVEKQNMTQTLSAKENKAPSTVVNATTKNKSSLNNNSELLSTKQINETSAIENNSPKNLSFLKNADLITEPANNSSKILLVSKNVSLIGETVNSENQRGEQAGLGNSSLKTIKLSSKPKTVKPDKASAITTPISVEVNKKITATNDPAKNNNSLIISEVTPVTKVSKNQINSLTKKAEKADESLTSFKAVKNSSKEKTSESESSKDDSKASVDDKKIVNENEDDKSSSVAEVCNSIEPEEPKKFNVPRDDIAKRLHLTAEASVEELSRLENEENVNNSSQSAEAAKSEESEKSEELAVEKAKPTTPKKKRKAKRKVVIRRIKRKLSKDDTFLHIQEAPSELEIEEKEIEENDAESENEEEQGPKQPKSCLKLRQFEIGDIVMYAERYKKTQVKWRKGVVIERITSISYKLDLDGEEKPAHISYIKKFTDRKVNFGGKEYLEIDYAQIEEDEEKERNYSIWNHV